MESLRIEVTFDNSKSNPFNPDPEQFVTWGDQTWQEMAIAFFDVSVPRSEKHRIALRALESKEKSESDQEQASPEEKAEAFVISYFERFDKNGDGVITRPELPISIRGYGFRSFDHNRDRNLSRDEIKAEALKRF